MRKRIYEVIEVAGGNDILSRIYDIFMILVIFASLIPLAFKDQRPLFVLMDRISVGIFIVDYILRLITADFKLGKGKIRSFLQYPLTPMAIIDLISILPSLTVMNNGFKVSKIIRLARAFRVFRVLKVVRYSKNLLLLLKVFRKLKEALMVVFGLVVTYVLISALIVFNVEPATFDSFFDAVYWATISLTTVGYGDIYPVSTAGQVITMLSAVIGVAVIALPSSIITAGYLEEVEKVDKKDKKKKNRKERREEPEVQNGQARMNEKILDSKG